MRLFYRCFPIRDTLRHELTWSHYRRLISVENEQARIWYMNEAADCFITVFVHTISIVGVVATFSLDITMC